MAGLLGVLVACGLLVLTQVYVAIPLAPVVGAEFGAGSGASLALVTAYGLAYAAGFLVFGPLSDHYGRKPILVWRMVALAVSTAACRARFLGGKLPVVALAYVGEAFPPRWPRPAPDRTLRP